MKALLLGDFCPTDVTIPLFKSGDIGTLFGNTIELFKGNDINFLNLECALTEHDKAIMKFGPPLKSPAKVAEIMKKIGINCCGLSNNHVFDFGVKGIEDMIKVLNNVGIIYTGFGENYEDSRKNLVIEKEGEKVCIVAVCEHEYSYALENRMGSRPFDEFDTIEDIRKAKSENDRVIVVYHGGKELCRYPSPRLLKVCRAMARAGADVVLCQHSHCIGCYEEYEDCHILYGQGNFHFVKEHDFDGWHSCLAVQYDTKDYSINFVSILSKERGIILAENEEKEKLLAEFFARNEELKNGEWKKGWHEFCESVAPSYKKVIKNACTDENTFYDDFFAHYLDCEAHTDVWRELFPTYNQTNEL